MSGKTHVLAALVILFAGISTAGVSQSLGHAGRDQDHGEEHSSENTEGPHCGGFWMTVDLLNGPDVVSETIDTKHQEVNGFRVWGTHGSGCLAAFQVRYLRSEDVDLIEEGEMVVVSKEHQGEKGTVVFCISE